MGQHVILEFAVIPEKRAEFIGMLNSVLHETLAYEGCQGVKVYSPEEDGSRLLLLEEWATKEDQVAYFNWRVETGLLEAITPFLAGEPSVTWLTSHN
ncbi:MAG: quinol monooxygenase YgiN [Kiritimatiellia bacterium]|jgi:quinol monooxygenase YgiN